MVLDLSAPLRPFSSLDHLRLIGVNQPRHFPIAGDAFPLEARPLLFGLDIHRWIAAPLLILHSQHSGVGQQRLRVIPDPSLKRRRTETAARACPRHVPWVAEGAEIPTALSTPGPDHAPATAPTDQETPPQIEMWRVVPLRLLPFRASWACARSQSS
jgi:hypothetical protein